ncbi:unnamed protein product [Cylicocyclus nassatus]|uniref:Uncharacterized protein n=1 Tax=Cylicocyclus nassatus TaxID=53992 RepID=A0AA36GS03_CYLNA|nr:unnamed protein product [Cylicocyclus nassatus]
MAASISSFVSWTEYSCINCDWCFHTQQYCVNFLYTTMTLMENTPIVASLNRSL